MEDTLMEWLLIGFRWLHIMAAIAWIGDSFFFMWMDRHLQKDPASSNPNQIGSLWMVHSGGFYRVEKTHLSPNEIPPQIYWFKWPASFTWISGMVLLLLIFYRGGGTFLLDETVSDISFFQGALIGLGSIFGSWFIYDAIWESKLNQKPLVAHALTLSLVLGVTYFLCHTLSGRAAYIHVGAMLGTWMVANVWTRILPRQRIMVNDAKGGKKANPEHGKNAKNRSIHNNYFTLPLIFIMMSNHFPSTYGHDLNWLVLVFIFIFGGSIRHIFNMTKPGNQTPKWPLVPALISLLVLINFTKEADGDYGGHDHSHIAVETKTKTSSPKKNLAQPETKASSVSETPNPVEEQTDMVKTTNASSPKVSAQDASKLFDLMGTITFKGELPSPKVHKLPKACQKQHKGPVLDNRILVSNNKLKNVYLRIVKGHESLPKGDVPVNEAVLDQIGCIYEPRVIGVRAGQKVAFLNSDPVFHNVKAVTKKNKRFNVAMPKKDQKIVKVFKNPEYFVKAKCSLHPWMGAIIAVSDHPYYSVSQEDGKFNISNLPAGKYTLSAKHETLGEKTLEVTLPLEGPLEISFNN